MSWILHVHAWFHRSYFIILHSNTIDIPPSKSVPCSLNLASAFEHIVRIPHAYTIPALSRYAESTEPTEKQPFAQIVACGVPKQITKADLRSKFAPFGGLLAAQLGVDAVSHVRNGTALVRFDTFEAAEKACQEVTEASTHLNCLTAAFCQHRLYNRMSRKVFIFALLLVVCDGVLHHCDTGEYRMRGIVF